MYVNPSKMLGENIEAISTKSEKIETGIRFEISIITPALSHPFSRAIYPVTTDERRTANTELFERVT